VRDEPRRGFLVAELGDEDVREVYELRATLETRAAYLMIERDSSAEFDELGMIVAGLRQAAANGDGSRDPRLPRRRA